MTAEPEAPKVVDLPRGIVRGVTPLSMWGGDTLIYRCIAALAGLALPIVVVVHWTMRGQLPWPQIAFTAVILAGSLACLEISRRGRREVAGAILVGLMWLTTTVYAFETGYGMRSAVVFVYVPCLLYTALFFGVAIAAGELALTAAALVLMYLAEVNGRIGGITEVVATGTAFNYLVGILVTLIATLAGGVTYHRRVEREAARVVAEAGRHLAALTGAQQARAQLEAAHAQLATAGVELDARAGQRDRELTRMRRTLELLRGALSGQAAELATFALRPLRREPLDLTALARQAADLVRRRTDSGRVQVRIDPGLRASGDRQMVETLLERLLERACRASRGEADPVVHFGGGSLDGHAVFFVRDNGPALDPFERASLFDPFRPGARAPDLGPALARCIAERHGGELEAESGAGNETTFFFSLPV